MKEFKFALLKIKGGKIISKNVVYQKATTEKWAKTLVWKRIKKDMMDNQKVEVKICDNTKSIRVYDKRGKYCYRLKLDSKYKIKSSSLGGLVAGVLGKIRSLRTVNKNGRL